ncbi:NAD(P)/FAD-dependent oxidoreductase [Pseudactinotalea sp. HY160]|uniref:NAD(P)/FAD-dependent oxidoreductase n=1 Tax=Pseudactinotalea sp. HY160 TaxID=2654490 RepID=UPI00128C36D8|nr:FAD-dependent oxidoreductase [Pseudactinotalea sp. HY160]MPV49493.1 NAD(P)/FAD-dependent oxidoreductase [Pseudactinotalea sp. HY160]
MSRRFIILGAGQAGGTAALTLRALGFDGTIELIGREPHIPYERPPLSKSYLAGEPYRSHDLLPHEDWYENHDVRFRRGRTAVGIDRARTRVLLDRGDRVDYDALLLATGSQPRRLTVPGGTGGQVHYLRTLEDSERLGARLRPGARVVIIGGGWIGLEVAATASLSGCHVTVVDPHDVSLQPTLGATVGGFFTGVHRAHGVDFRFGRRATEIRARAGTTRVVLDDGDSLRADCVVIAIGAVPDTGLVDPELLGADGGVRVDSRMRTKDPHVFAAGDIAAVANGFYGTSLRSEHWANALMSGEIAARSMLGRDSEFDPVPFVFTDQYDLFVEYAGWVRRGAAEEPVIRGDPAARAFQAFWLADGRVVAAMHVNRRDEGMTPLQDLIRARVRVDPSRLADPQVPLPSLLD